jgi:hypothetical protein
LALFGFVPVGIVFAGELAAELLQVIGMLLRALASDCRQRRGFTFAIGAESAGDRFSGNSDVQLRVPGGFGEIKVHLRAVGRFVRGEADIAIDAREIFAYAAADGELAIQRQGEWREAIEQHAKRLDDRGAVTAAVLVHPWLAVVAGKIAEKAEYFRGENRLLTRRHCRPALVAAAASAAAASAAAARGIRGGRTAVRGPRSVRGRRKDRKLDRVLRAFALGAGDFRAFAHDELFVALAAIVTEIFENGHFLAPSLWSSYREFFALGVAQALKQQPRFVPGL